MRFDEFQLPDNADTDVISVEDQQKIVAVAAAGESAWSEPLEVDQAIALARKFAGVPDVR